VTLKKSLFEFLGLKRNILVLLGGMLLTSTGERLWLGFAPKYLETLGGSIFLIGVYDALQTFLGAIYAYPGAWLWKIGPEFNFYGAALCGALGTIWFYFSNRKTATSL
jgi:hypothetical protein